MNRGDIYFVSLEPTVGHEQQGHRPVLIIYPDRFNKRTNTQVIVPITTGGQFARDIGLAVSLDSQGLKTSGVVRADQPRTIDLGKRNGRRVEAVPTHILTAVLERVSSLFDPEAL